MEQILSRAGERDAFFWGTHAALNWICYCWKKGSAGD